MPTHVYVSRRVTGLYRDPADNLAGERYCLFVHRERSLHRVDVYTVVVPDQQTLLEQMMKGL